MKPQAKNLRTSRAAFIASGIALAMGMGALSARADQWDKKTVLSIDQPMQVRDTYLEPGQYVFKLLNSKSDRHIVQIYNADQTHLINTVMAIPDYRVQVTSKPRFIMWETPAGSVNALRAWFYPGDNFGQEFPYPRHLQQIAFAQAPVPTLAPAPPPPPEPVTPPAAEPQASTEPQPQNEIAQNNPPPAPPAAAAQPATQPAASSPPAVLPKTASPYPLIGFSGLALLGIGGLLRRTRSV